MICKHGTEISQNVDGQKCEQCLKEARDRIEAAISYLKKNPRVCRRIAS